MRSLHLQRRVVLSSLVVGVAGVIGSIGCGGAPSSSQSPPHTGANVAVQLKHPFQALSADGWSDFEEEDEMDIAIPVVDPLHASGSVDLTKAMFRGKDRSGAKTSLVENVALESFSSVGELQKQLPRDQAMLEHDPEITKQLMDRVDEERRMVHVDAWIYAIKYEKDNDWHIIAGTDPDARSIRYFNAEVSGLPKKSSPALATLREVRQSLAAILDNQLPGSSSYHKYNPPIAVTIEGAVFFDIDHAAGAVGPGDMKPTTAWEIHPISSLVER